MSDSSYILIGPEHESPVPEESFAEMVWNSLKNRDPEQTICVDAVTKEILTYGKLLNSSLKLIQVLKKFDLKEGDVISITSENKLNFCIPLIASILMGVSVSPVNQDYSIGELTYVLNISKPKLIFCSNKALNNILRLKRESALVTPIITIDHEQTNFDSEVKLLKHLLREELVDVDSFKPTKKGNFIYMSSGTTGLPKGALLTHSNIKEALITFLNPTYWNINSKDKSILALPCFHLYGTLILLAAVLSSMKIVLINKFQPEIFLESIENYKINKLFLVPSLLLFLMKSPIVKNYDISSIDDIVISAAPVGKDLQIEAMEILGSKIRVCYAMTEMSGTCTIQMIGEVKPGSVGKLAPRLSAKVWNPDSNQNLGPHQVGELCFKGPTVLQGYIGDPKAKQESFDEDGFYHSGDTGFYDNDGIFYIAGRIKEIIKYKGYQVPPEELETLILTHPTVKDCGVIGIPDERAGEVPLAFVVIRENCAVTKEEIVNFVSERISIQKHLYGGVKFLQQIPRNPSGKILRRKLLEIYDTCKQRS